MNALETIDMSTALTPAPQPERAAGPLALLQSGVDLDKVERLWAMQVQWEQREAEKAYNEAFAAFKSEAVKIVKNRKVTAGPLEGKRYAELFAVVNAITPALSAHGLSAAWRLTRDEKDWLEVTCTLKHALGHSESVSMGGPPDVGGAKNAIQARASTITYLERYTLKAITGLSEQEDDNDGAGGASDEAGGNADAEDGKAAAQHGTKALTEWWGSLTAKRRSALNKVFPGLRAEAQAIDKAAGRA